MEHIKGILFVDIETVPLFDDFTLLTEGMQREWTKKSKMLKFASEAALEPAIAFSERAGIYSEFAKVVCISIGSLHHNDGVWRIRLKSLVNNDEKALLAEFCEVISKFGAHHKDFRFCGHNIKEFDIPFLCRRMIINQMGLPLCMQVAGKKPWEVTHIDTMDLWRFGDYKNYTPLSLLAEVLGIPSPKNDIDGSMVSTVYWKDNDLQRIGTYCAGDVLTSAKVYLRLAGLHHIVPEPVMVTE